MPLPLVPPSILVATQAATILLSCGIPFILPSNGTVGTNGALTVNVALPTTYAKAYVWMPTGAINSGSTQGWYYAVFSSITVATLYNNTYATGTPSVPTSVTAFSGTTGIAYTQTTGTPVTAASITVPGGAMGANGRLRMELGHAYVTDANTKTFTTTLGGTTFASFAASATTVGREVPTIWNCGSQSINAGNNTVSLSGSGSDSFLRGAVVTSSPQTLAFTMQLASGTGATDFAVNEYVGVEVINEA